MKKILIDSIILALSIVFAIYLVQSGILIALLAWIDNAIVVSFVAGLFFTSFFTTPPAIAALGEIALEGNIFITALVGGLGAMVGDFILFAFVRDHIVRDAGELMRGPHMRRMIRVLRRSHLQRVLPLIGALIIASPFPDEIGLALIGIARLRTPRFLLLSFTMNAIGILIIGFVAQMVAAG